MGAAKILWEIELEEVGNGLEAGEFTRDEAVTAWVKLGMDRDEAENWADSVQGLV